MADEHVRKDRSEDGTEYIILAPGAQIPYDAQCLSGEWLEPRAGSASYPESREFWAPVPYLYLGKRVQDYQSRTFRRPKEPDPNWDCVSYFDEVTADCEYFDTDRLHWRRVTPDMIPGDWSKLQHGRVMRKPRREKKEEEKMAESTEIKKKKKKTRTQRSPRSASRKRESEPGSRQHLMVLPPMSWWSW